MDFDRTRVLVLDSTATVRDARRVPGHPFIGGGKKFALLFNETTFKKCTEQEATKFEKNINARIQGGRKYKKSKKIKQNEKVIN
jgi:hypothetical protein